MLAIRKSKRPEAGCTLCRPVAFRCKNPDVANLSRHMVISNIRQGDAWHNNYALISFGSLDERYSWENLDGGILEKLALCTHMQYCAVPPGTSHSYADDGQGEQDQGAAEAFRSYYGSQYNMDSSLSVALSLPYRLFHMFRAHRRLVKKPWNILDGDAYYSRETLQEFGEELSALGRKVKLFHGSAGQMGASAMDSVYVRPRMAACR